MVAAAIMLMVSVPEQRQVGLVDKNRAEIETPSTAEADSLLSADSQTASGEAEAPLGKPRPQAAALAENLAAVTSEMSDAVLIVRLDVTPAALADRAFERSLASHQISIISPTDPSSTVARFLDKRGEGAYSIALRVDNLLEIMEEWSAIGIEWILPEPYEFPPGSSCVQYLPDKLIANWVKPSSMNGVLFEAFELQGNIRPFGEE